MATTTNRLPAYNRDDLVQASKAIYDKVHGELEEGLADAKSVALQVGGMFERKFEKRLQALEENVKQLHDTYHAGLKHIEALLKSLPVPTANFHLEVPENAITTEVKMLPVQAPDVHVSVEAPRVENVVNVPEQKAMFTVPVPEVNVTMPAHKSVQKSIVYDDFGRPATILEKSVE